MRPIETGSSDFVGRFALPSTIDGAEHEHTEDDWLSTLMASPDMAACVIEPGRNGDALDFRFVEVSPAFAAATGLEDACGRSMRELRPDHENHWFEMFDRIARTGAPVSFEHVAAALARRFRGHAFRIGAPGDWQVVVMFEDLGPTAAPEVEKMDGAMVPDSGDAPLERYGATLAHELRSPLAPIGNGLHILKLLARNLPQFQETLAMMDRQFAQLTGLIDGLLDLGRIGSASGRLLKSAVDLHHVISDSIEASAAAIQARQHDVAIDSEATGLRVRGDARRLTQVFTNLLTNSVKYTPPGGHILITMRALNGMAIVDIRDDGIGIPSDYLPHVFDLFNQVPIHRDQADGGLGIGLAVVRRIVRMHGGSVAAHSDGTGRGSTFTVSLPHAPLT